MNHDEYSIYGVLAQIPDPRAARGQRHEWTLILLLIVAAMASNQHNLRAIGQWVKEREEELIEQLKPPRDRLPSAATLRRGLQAVDLVELERVVAAQIARHSAIEGSYDQTLCPDPLWQGVAADGKWLRGTKGAGQPQAKVVALVNHTSAEVIAQQAIPWEGSEQQTVATLLADTDLTQRVVTVDALHTDRDLARQIVQQGGDYLMVVKRNQPTLRREISLLMDTPPWQPATAAPEQATYRTVTKAHGRLESRHLDLNWALDDFFDWPHARQVVRRTTRRIILATGEIQEEVQLAITSLAPSEAGPEHIEALWRAHWTIENRLHYVRCHLS